MVNTIPTIVHGKSAEHVNDGPQSAITLFLDGPDTAGSVTVNRSFLGAGTAGAPAHENRHASETIFVIDGCLRQATSDRFDNHYVASPNWQTSVPS